MEGDPIYDFLPTPQVSYLWCQDFYCNLIHIPHGIGGVLGFDICPDVLLNIRMVARPKLCLSSERGHKVDIDREGGSLIIQGKQGWVWE